MPTLHTPHPAPWPPLAYEDWSDTLETIHMWTQIVGKIRLALTPWTSHSWHVPLYVTPTGLTTSTMYDGTRPLDIEFDFHRHTLVIRSGSQTRQMELQPQSVAEFYRQVKGHLKGLGHSIEIYEIPSELPDPIPFSEDVVHKSYDRDAVARFIDATNQTTRVFTNFRSRFIGKCSPVHFFWGGFDLAVTRFSGREAPPHPGGIPGLADWVTREAYSHEVYSCGFWPGAPSSPAPAFYAYAVPTPEGLGDASVQPDAAFWSTEMGEFFLPYEAVRNSDNPDQLLLQFLESTYDAVATKGDWDRDKLEAPSGYPRSL